MFFLAKVVAMIASSSAFKYHRARKNKPPVVTCGFIGMRWATRPIVHPQQKQIGMLVRWSH
jgi:hypothetical protein